MVHVILGFGKTIMALKLIQELQKKTLIIVNKLVLVQQWKKLSRVFLNIDPTIIKGKGSKIKNNSIYIINAINIPKHDFSQLEIGTVIVDECHMILTTCFQSRSFSSYTKIFDRAVCDYPSVWMVSILYLIFSLALFRVHRNLHKEHQVLQINTKEKIEHTLDKYGNINWNSVIDQQSKSEERKMMICDYCQQYPDRNILILCKRIEQMERLHEELQSRGEYSVVFKENDITFDKKLSDFSKFFSKMRYRIFFQQIKYVNTWC